MVKIGEEIEFGGEKFVIVKIVRDDTSSGKVLYVTAYDADTANKEQENQIKADQMKDGLVETISKLLKDGKGGFGMNLGG